MKIAPNSLVGMSIEWTGVHYSKQGDFTDLSTHTVTYETENACYVTVGGKLVGEARYSYKRLNDRMSICLYYPEEYQGRSGVVLNAMFDFYKMKDRAVILENGEPFAVAEGDMLEVETPTKPIKK
jgi:hypothetical protein